MKNKMWFATINGYNPDFGKEFTHYAFISADNLIDAARKIEELYGQDFYKIELECYSMERYDIVYIPAECVDAVKEENNY